MAASAQPIAGLPRLLTIAGSDSGGGAGIQADLKVFFALGCHGMSAITALTAQNTVAVTGVHEAPSEFVIAQIDAVASDIGVDAAKTGMLSSAAIVEAVAKAIEAHAIAPVVVDPVSISKSGDTLLAPDAVDALRSRLVPRAAVVTPNLHEAGALLGGDVRTLDDMRAAARELCELGAGYALVKGGHLGGPEAIDIGFDGRRMHELRAVRYDTRDTHGTGCALAAAIAARLGHGDEVDEAVRFAKDFVAGAIRQGLQLGRGHGPVNPAWRAVIPPAGRTPEDPTAL